MKRVLVLVVVAVLASVTTYLFTRPTVQGTVETRSPERPDVKVLRKDVHAILDLAVVKDSYEELFTQADSKVIAQVVGKLGFKKKAMLRVKGKATVGFEIRDADIVADTTHRQLLVRTTADPIILAIEHDVDYLDLEQNLMNRFKAEDLTAINAMGKARIQEKAMKGDLFDRARSKRAEVLDVIRNYVHAQGWQLVVDSTYQVAEVR